MKPPRVDISSTASRRFGHTESASGDGVLGAGLGRQVVLHTRRHSRRLVADQAAIVGVIAAPILYFLGFYVPLQGAMRAQGLDYAQYIGPALVVQSSLFTAMASASAMAVERESGLLRRLAVMPVNRWAPLLGRLAVDAVCGLVGAAAAVGIAAAVGFRFSGFGGVLGFAAAVVVFTLALSVLFDAVALGAGDPAATAEALLVPQLVLLMFSTAFIPAAQFPSWLRPVVTGQPVSQVLEVLRGFSAGAATGGAVLVALGWCVLLGGIGALLLARRPKEAL